MCNSSTALCRRWLGRKYVVAIFYPKVFHRCSRYWSRLDGTKNLYAFTEDFSLILVLRITSYPLQGVLLMPRRYWRKSRTRDKIKSRLIWKKTQFGRMLAAKTEMHLEGFLLARTPFYVYFECSKNLEKDLNDILNERRKQPGPSQIL